MTTTKTTQLYDFKCDECGEIETAEWDIAGDRHDAIDCVKGVLVYVGPVAPEETARDIGTISVDEKCDHGVAKFLRCEQCVLEGVYTHAQPEEHESAQSDPDLGIIADEFSAEMQKQPEDRAPETFDKLLNAALAHGAAQEPTVEGQLAAAEILSQGSTQEQADEWYKNTEKVLGVHIMTDDEFDEVSPNTDGQESPVASTEPETSTTIALEPENTLESLLDTENDTIESADEEEIAEPTSSEPEPTLNDILPDFDSLAAGENVAKETVVLELHVRRPSFRRAFRSEDILISTGVKRESFDDGDDEKRVDADYIRVSKDIIDRNEIRNINKRIGVLKTYMRTRCVPSSILAAGLYLLPIKFIQEMDVAISSSQTDIETLLNEFEPRYPAMIENAKVKLGPHFNASDYPQFSVLRAQWRIDAQYRSLNVPAVLQKVSSELFKREQTKIRLQFADTAQEVRDALRVGFTRMVSEFSEKLGKDEETGKPKVFQKQRLDKLRDFMDTFDGARDLTNDIELQNLVKQARALIEGVDPKSLRKDEALRTAMETGFAKIAEDASKMVVVRERVLADDED